MGDCTVCKALKALLRLAGVLCMIPVLSLLIKLNVNTTGDWLSPTAQGVMLPSASTAEPVGIPLVYVLDAEPSDLNALSAACGIPAQLLNGLVRPRT